MINILVEKLHRVFQFTNILLHSLTLNSEFSLNIVGNISDNVNIKCLQNSLWFYLF